MNAKLVTAVLLGISLLPLSASARVRDTSTRHRPQGLGLADVDGDRVGDWFALDSGITNGLQVRLGSNSQSTIARLNGGFLGANGRTMTGYAFTGRFASKTRDDVCGFYMSFNAWLNTRIGCFEYDSFSQQMFSFGGQEGSVGGAMTWAMPSQLTPVTEGRGYAVGDYDGDGYDEVLTYDRTNGSGAQIWRFRNGSFIAATDIPIGNLAQLNWPGGVEIWAGELTGPDADGSRRDDLMVMNRSTGEVALFGSVKPSGQVTFWWFYTAWSPITAAEDVAVANADGDAYDDLISVNRTTGAMRFLRLEGSAILAPLSVVQGNLPSASPQPLRLLWSSTPGTRDQPVATFADHSVALYYPATDGNFQKTYWWSITYSLGYVWSRIAP